MTDKPTDDRFYVIHNALIASLADDGITLPGTITVAATNRILTRLTNIDKDTK